MAKKKRTVDPNETLVLLELRMAVIAHCTALKAVAMLLEQDKREAAIARLDGAVTAMHAVVRGQCAGVTMACPVCKTAQGVVEWADDGKCDACGSPLEIPGQSEM